ncbi:MAG: hypothetical protein QNK04_24900, partial [Myxococcota bacterium]|nr:hypothetical protein [Myxococcota bacterium]
MNPTATRRLRRSSAIVAVVWSLVALVLAAVGQFTAQRGANPPIETSGIGGYAIVQWATEAALEAGVSVGDRVLEVDGEPVHSWFRERGWERLSEQVPVAYTLERRDGRVFQVELSPVQRSSNYTRFFVPIFSASLVVGIAYLAIGLLVWRLKPDTADSWAFLLFCSAVAAQLATSIHTYDALWGYPRMLVNLPLVGATTFHLFTTIPREPEWVVRRPQLRLLPYGVAALLALWVVAEGGTTHSAWLPKTAFAAAFLGAGAGLAVLTRERFASRETRDAGRTDVIFLGALLSFAPVVLTIAAQLVLRVSFPTSVALLWWVVFPMAVAYGIARRQLFDIRGTARSSATYGAATLAITGLFALLITFADATFARFRMNSGSGWFSVIFLFFAILAFNPLR